MRKIVFAVSVTALFFFLGRQSSLKTDFVPFSHPSAQHSALSVPSQPNLKVTATKNSEVSDHQIDSAKQVTLADKLLTEKDSQLFQTLYSSDFKENFKTSFSILKTRLLLPLPSPKLSVDAFDKEVTARMGILKSLSIAEDNDPEVRDFLFTLLERPQPWILQREAIHVLVTKNDLSQTEKGRALKFLDPRTRNTASLSDQDLLERTVEGEQ